MAALGANGTNPKNCSTDIMDFARKLIGPALLPVYIALIPMFVAKSENGLPEPELCSAGLLLPHIWFWFLHTLHPNSFLSDCSGAPRRRRRHASLDTGTQSAHMTHADCHVWRGHTTVKRLCR